MLVQWPNSLPERTVVIFFHFLLWLYFSSLVYIMYVYLLSIRGSQNIIYIAGMSLYSLAVFIFFNNNSQSRKMGTLRFFLQRYIFIPTFITKASVRHVNADGTLYCKRLSLRMSGFWSISPMLSKFFFVMPRKHFCIS